MDYKRAYQIVLKKVEDLEKEQELQREALDYWKLKLGRCGQNLARVEAENDRLRSLIDEMAETAKSIRQSMKSIAIHPQSE